MSNTLLIQNFDQFLDALNLCEAGIMNYEEVFKSADINFEEVAMYSSWNSDKYGRDSILKKDDFEVFVLCFEPGQQTEIYNHASQEEWLYLVSGELVKAEFLVKEETNIQLQSEKVLKPKDVAQTMGKTVFQRLTNTSEERCFCIQLFTKPLKRMNVYLEDTGNIIDYQLK